MNTKTTLVLALVAVLVAVGLYFTKPWETREKSVQEQEPTAKALFGDTPWDIDRIELTIPGSRHSRRVLVKEDDRWMLVEPIQGPAQDSQATSIIRAVSEAEYVRKYARDDSGYPVESITGLQQPEVTVRLFSGGETKADFRLGKRVPTGKGAYAALGDDGVVYELKDSPAPTLTLRLDRLRNKQIIKLDQTKVTEVEVSGQSNYRIVKGTDGAWIMEQPQRGRVEKSKAEDVVRQVGSLWVQNWVEDEPGSLHPYGLDQPRIRAVVTLTEPVEEETKQDEGEDAQDGEGDRKPEPKFTRHELLVGGSTGDNAYYAKTGDSDAVFTIGSYVFDKLAQDPGELRDKSFASLPATQVSKIVVSRPDGEYTLSRKGGTWSLADGESADTGAVNDLIRDINAIEATSFVRPEEPLVAVDWNKPRVKLSVTVEGEEAPVVLLIGPASTSGKMSYVRRGSEEAVAVVREELVTPLLRGAASYGDRQVLNVPGDRVQRLEVTRAGSPTVALEKKDNKWSIVSPVEAPADQPAVTRIVRDLSNLRARSLLGAVARSEYGLDNPEITLALHAIPPAADPDVKEIGEDDSAEAPITPARHPSMTDRSLLSYLMSLPEDQRNPKAVQMLQDLIAAEGEATRPDQPVKHPSMSNEALLDYLMKLPEEERNPLVVTLLEDLVAREKASAGQELSSQAQARPSSEQWASARAAATRPASAERMPALSHQELLDYVLSLPGDEQNPKAIEMLRDLIALETGQALVSDQSDDKEKAPVYTNQELLDHIMTLPEEERNPLAIEMLENLIAEEQGAKGEAVDDKKQARPEVYRLALSRVDGKTYAFLVGGETVYELDSNVYDTASAELHDRRVIQFEADSATSVFLSDGDDEMSFIKSGEDWKYGPDPVLPIDKAKVRELINAFRELKTERYVDYVASDLDRYGLGSESKVRRVGAVVQGGERVEILLSRMGPEGDGSDSRYAVKAGESKIFLIRGEDVEKLSKSLEDFEKSS